MIDLFTPKELASKIAGACRDRRIALGLSVTTLANNAGVSRGTLHRFEKTGQVNLSNLSAILIALRMDTQVLEAFTTRKWWSLDELQRLDRKTEK